MNSDSPKRLIDSKGFKRTKRKYHQAFPNHQEECSYKKMMKLDNNIKNNPFENKNYLNQGISNPYFLNNIYANDYKDKNLKFNIDSRDLSLSAINNFNINDHYSTKINSKNDNGNIPFRKNSFEMPLENSLSETNNNFQGI